MQDEEQFQRLNAQQGVKGGNDKFDVCVPQANISSTPLKLKGSMKLDPICYIN